MFLGEKSGASKTRAHKMIRSKSVLVNNKVVAKAGYIVKRNDVIRIIGETADIEESDGKGANGTSS